MKEEPRYTLVLRPLTTGWRTTPETRLRAVLKRLLRSYGFRCVSVAPAPAEKDKDKGQ